MSNGRKKAIGSLAASILLAASLAAAPAIAKKPPPPPPEEPDPWEGCTPWGPVIYGVDCCDYPDLQVPCESSTSDPVIRPEDGSAVASGQ